MHIHVGSNTPGCLPEGGVSCFSTVEDAVVMLKHELKDQQDCYWLQCEQDYYWLQCEEGVMNCGCAWCDVASDVEAALVRIADGDTAHYARQGQGTLHLFSPPEGPDVVHWLMFADGAQADCDANEH